MTVPEGDQSREPEGRERVGVYAAAASGDQLATLRAVRDELARQIDASRDPFGLPALAARLVAVLGEIAKLEPPEPKGTALDELKARRARRSPTGSGGSAVGGE